MKTTFKTKYNEIEYTIDHAGHFSSGHGHKKISVEIECSGQTVSFIATASNMYDFDKAMNLSDGLDMQEYYESLFSLVKSQLDDQIEEWASDELDKIHCGSCGHSFSEDDAFIEEVHSRDMLTPPDYYMHCPNCDIRLGLMES